MTDPVLYALTLAAALGCGLNAGIFFAFSTFVMQGLKRAGPTAGIRAMQGINVTAVTPPFMMVLFGSAGLSMALALWALVAWPGAAGDWLLAGAALNLPGAIGVTIAANVPRNNALAKADPDGTAGAALWAIYLRQWTGWNHLRTAACLGAAGCFTIGLSLPG